MITDTTAAPTGSPRTASPRQLDWLRAELAAWREDGLLEAGQAEAVLARYSTSRRLSVGRLLLVLGAGFVGVGVLWLVAANLEALSPLGRFVVLSALWLGLLVGGEVLGIRGSRGRGQHALAQVVRTLAALVFGAVVFQAAQSLQVPAWEPALLGWWAAGALVQAYAVRAVGPLLVGVLSGLGWFVWVAVEAAPSGLDVVLAVLVAAVLATGLAALHSRALTAFSAPWREVGALLALGGLFAAAHPYVTADGFAWTPWLVAGVLAAVVAVAAGCAVTRGQDRLEPLGAVGVAVLGVLLVLWDTGAESGPVGADDWLHAVVSVFVYVVVAVGVAVLGTLRDSWPLRALATSAIVVFTTFQSFSVFARIIEGAWLFVVLGLVFLGTGVLFDRARRELVAALEPGEDRS